LQACRMLQAGSADHYARPCTAHRDTPTRVQSFVGAQCCVDVVSVLGSSSLVSEPTGPGHDVSYCRPQSAQHYHAIYVCWLDLLLNDGRQHIRDPRPSCTRPPLEYARRATQHTQCVKALMIMYLCTAYSCCWPLLSVGTRHEVQAEIPVTLSPAIPRRRRRPPPWLRGCMPSLCGVAWRPGHPANARCVTMIALSC
jgi:hypothetical protein